LSFGVEKAIRGIHGNVFLRAFFENFGKSADFELKMPFKKVGNGARS
jgi:hypothetical protein